MTAKERYWKNSLLLFIFILGIVLFSQFYSMLSGLLGAFTVYILVRKQQFFFTEKKRMKKGLSAAIILLEVILCILIPSFLIIWFLLGKIQTIEIHPTALISSLQQYVEIVQEKIGYNILSQENIGTITSFLSYGVQKVAGEISSFVMTSVVLLLILYFMLTSGRRMEAYITELLPLKNENKQSILSEIHVMVVSNAVGIPLLALIQGIIGLAGYLIFGVPHALVFGLLTCFASIIPVVGTAIVWIPLCIYFAVTGNWFGAIGLFLYSGIILTNVDNLIRFILQKKLADTHPLITIFGVIIGLTLFGFWGVIFGPLMLAMFFLCIDIYKREYIDNNMV